jgi:hypothetical protein
MRLWGIGVSGSKLYYSDDAGFTWDSLTVAAEVALLGNLWIAPNDVNILWLAAAGSGVYFSANRGANWTQSLAVTSPTRVDDIEGNPQNPNSAIAVFRQDSLAWNHGDGVWERLAVPLSGNAGDMIFLQNDSTNILTVRGYDEPNNLLHSMDAGQTWFIDDGPFYTVSAGQLEILDRVRGLICAYLNVGMLVSTSNWQDKHHVSIGSDLWRKYFRFSTQTPRIVWGYQYSYFGDEAEAIWVSNNGGMTWQLTPFMARSHSYAQVPGRDAIYVVYQNRDLFILSYPDLSFEQLNTPAGTTLISVIASPADTSVLYAFNYGTGLNVSEDRGITWRTVTWPVEALYEILPSPASRSRVFLWSGLFDPVEVWRTDDFGAGWQLIFHRNSGVIVDSWVSREAPNDLNVCIRRANEEWYFYSTDGGLTFDSVLTAAQDQGYHVYPWGDSLGAISVLSLPQNADSAFVTTDRGHAFQFRAALPEVTRYRHVLFGKFSQILVDDYETDRLFYYSPLQDNSPYPTAQPISGMCKLEVFPNPANASSFLKLQLPQLADPVRIRFFDILGREVQTILLSGRTGASQVIPLPIETLPSGTYLLRLETTKSQPLGKTRLTIIR